MSFNLIVFWGLHIITSILYLYTYYKFKSAKRLDDTLEVKMNMRSKIEFYGIALLNVAGFIYQPTTETVGVANFLLAALLFLTYMNLDRLVIVGRRIIFTKFLAFDIKMIKSKEYKRGKFAFRIRDGEVKVRFPVTDPEYLMQMLSGSYRRTNKKR